MNVAGNPAFSGGDVPQNACRYQGPTIGCHLSFWNVMLLQPIRRDLSDVRWLCPCFPARAAVSPARRCAPARGVREYLTDTVSGKQTERPGFGTALEVLRAGDTLVVWKLDRLGRSLSHLVTIVTDLQHQGIHFKSLQEQIDTTSGTGKLVFHLFAALAEFERDLIRERTLARLSGHSGAWQAWRPSQSTGYQASNGYPCALPTARSLL